MLISPLTLYDTKMRTGMNDRLSIFSSLNAMARSQSSSSEESLPMTPSMNSVLSQIKKHSSSVSSVETSLDYEDDPFQFDHLLSSMKRATSEDSCTTMASSCSVVDSHPLLEDVPSEEEKVIPAMKAFNLADMDLEDEWELDDLVQLIPPVYERKAKKRNLRLQNNPAYSKPMIYENDRVELEHWPLSKEPTQQPELSVNFILPNKRSRQQTLNPNFLKLYSIEMSSKYKKLLPDINVDDSILSQLTIDEIKNLDINSNDEPVSSNDIKLALITRKKLWSNMTHLQRQDLFGVSSPWNLKFVIRGDQHTDGKESSLVRVKSDVKPWLGDDSIVKNKTMLKPCGKLKLGSNPTSSEVQYVVKGWCDSRFV